MSDRIQLAPGDGHPETGHIPRPVPGDGDVLAR
jgi:hypothetical protein